MVAEEKAECPDTERHPNIADTLVQRDRITTRKERVCKGMSLKVGGEGLSLLHNGCCLALSGLFLCPGKAPRSRSFSDI